MAKSEKPEENLEEKARELWGDPERELDEYDLELARLQNELDEEEQAAEAAQEKAQLEAAAAEKARRKAAKEAAGEGSADDEEASEEDSEDEEHTEETADEPGAADEDESLGARGKRHLDEAADQAAREVAAEAMKGGGVKNAALTVVKRRLPGLPSRTQFRNAALGVAGAGVSLWLLWGILAPIFGWAWWLAKWGLVGGAGYGAYATYQMLPDRGGGDAADDAEATDEDEDDQEERT